MAIIRRLRVTLTVKGLYPTPRAVAMSVTEFRRGRSPGRSLPAVADSPPAVVALRPGGRRVDLRPAAEQVADDLVAPPAGQPHRHRVAALRPVVADQTPGHPAVRHVLE